MTATKAASDRITLGAIGLGGRNCQVIKEFLAQPGTQIAYISDVDTRQYERGFEAVKELQDQKPEAIQDFRRMLDDPEVDAVLIATGAHWHALATIMACQAGKDVYVEKPCSHDIYENRKMVEAARKYGRIVQVGSQNRSAPYLQHAIEYLRAGNLGTIHLVRVQNLLEKRRPKKSPYVGMPVPRELDYDMWCGPAPMQAFNPERTTEGWRYFWDYSGSDSESIHQVDVARWIVGQEFPKSVHAAGGLYFPEVNLELPDTLITTYEYEGITLVFELTWWTPYMIKTPWAIRDSDQFPDWDFNGTKIEVYGSDGRMVVGRHGGGWQTWGPNGDVGPSEYGKHPLTEHVRNFLSCVQTRERPNADVEIGHVSQSIVHMAYISYRVGQRSLRFDSASETFIDDDEANRFLGRLDGGRAPWKIPQQV